MTEQGHHAGMVGCETLFQGESEVAEMQGLQVISAELPLDHLVDDASDSSGFLVRRQFQARSQTLFDSLVAAIAREDEVNAWQHTEIIELIDDGPTTRDMSVRSFFSPCNTRMP
jgi:hypothetical protein